MGSYSQNQSANYTFYLTLPTPFLKSEIKYIYNIKKRESKGKNTLNNSGNYIGTQVKYSFAKSGNSELNQTLLTEVH